MQQRSVEHCWPLARAVAALATARDAQQVDRPSLPRGAHRGHVPDPRWVAPCEATQLLHRFRCTEEAADAAAQGRVLVRQRRWRRRKSTPIRVRSVSVVAAEVGVHQACTCASCLLQAAPLLGAAAKRHGAPSGILADRPGGGRRQLANCCWPRCPQLDEHVRRHRRGASAVLASLQRTSPNTLHHTAHAAHQQRTHSYRLHVRRASDRYTTVVFGLRYCMPHHASHRRTPVLPEGALRGWKVRLSSPATFPPGTRARDG